MEPPPAATFVAPAPVSAPRLALTSSGRSTARALAVYHPICLEHRVPQDLAVEVPRRLEVAMAAIDTVERDYPELLQVERRPPPVQMKWVRAVHDAGYVLRMSQKIATAKELPLHVTQTTQEEEMEDQSGVCASPPSMIGETYRTSRRQGHVRQRPLLGRRAPCRWCRLSRSRYTLMTFLVHSSPDRSNCSAGLRHQDVRTASPTLTLLTRLSAICAVRPPGHHCGRAGRTDDVKSQGFCFLNNVAIGAKYASLKHNVARIAVGADRRGGRRGPAWCAQSALSFASSVVC